MTRISPSPPPLSFDVEGEGAAPRATAGAPFRAALRAANKDKPLRLADEPGAPPAPPPPPAPIAPDEKRGEVRAEATRTESTESIDAADAAGAPSADQAQPRASDARSERDKERVGGDRTDAAAGGAAILDPSLAQLGLAPTQAAAPAAACADLTDSPVAAWVAAAVSRAIGKLGAPGASPATGATGESAAAATAAPAPATAAAATAAATLSALTPLEQAVHDLIGGIAGGDPAHARDARSAAHELDAAALPVFTGPDAATRIAPDVRGAASEPPRGAPVAQLPEQAANPSHIHLVLDDGPDRTVVTVAVRGSEVRVALRAHDDTAATALARNAASLDHAMRARGLALGELTTEREPRDPPPRRDPEPQERRPSTAEPFELEEKP